LREDYPSKPDYERPTWVMILAIAGLAIGCLGVIDSAFQIAMPKIIEFQLKFFQAMEKGLDKSIERMEEEQKKAEETGSPSRPGVQKPPVEVPKAFFGVFRNFLIIPDWYRKVIVVFGVFGLLISVFFILASVLLFRCDRESVRLYCIAMIFGIIYTLADVVAAACSNSFLGYSVMMPALIGAVASFVLLFVAITADKSSLKPADSREGHPGDGSNFPE
jgi:hypothetical protein